MKKSGRFQKKESISNIYLLTIEYIMKLLYLKPLLHSVLKSIVNLNLIICTCDNPLLFYSFIHLIFTSMKYISHQNSY